MEVQEGLQKAYLQFILTHGERPKSVYIFAKENEMAEEEFYRYFGSFEGIEQSIWAELMSKATAEVKNQEVWGQYSAREKALSLFYSFFELLKSYRSFAAFTLPEGSGKLHSPRVLDSLRTAFERFNQEILQEGIESGELMDRPFFSGRYKDALWVQFNFILKFWLKDTSAGFEKTDEAIERGINVAFDFFQRSPLDNLLEYGKFLANNSGIKAPF